VAYEQPLLVQGGFKPYTWARSDGVLPDGMILSTNTGWLSGVPTTTGATTFTIEVSDDVGDTAARTYTLYVFAADTNMPMILPSELAPAIVGQPVMVGLQAAGLAAPLAWDTQDTLPSGIALDEDSGILYGTPTEEDVATFTVEATDGDKLASRTFIWQIAAATDALTLLPAKLPVGSPGVPYVYQLTAQGGSPPYVFALVEGALPSGMVLHAQTGAVLGQPCETGAFPFVISVRDLAGTGARAYQHYLLQVASMSGLKIETAFLPDGRVQRAYALELQRSGGLAPYNWFLVGGTLPAGLTLAPQGILHGTPTATGMFWCTFGLASGDAQVAQQFYGLRIHPAPETLAFDTAALPDGIAAKAYATLIKVRGGVPPYTWSVVTGALPAGVALMPETGLLGGFPGETGAFPFVCRVSGSDGTTADGSFTLKIVPLDNGLRFVTDLLPPASVAVAYHHAIEVTGGTAPYRWEIVSGGLPAGLALGTNSGSIFGTPSSAGSYDVMIAAADSAGESITRLFTLNVVVPEKALNIDTAELDDGVQGEEYEDTLLSSGGRLPHVWAIASGALPPGLTLSPTKGDIKGTPTTFGAWAFTARVVDKLGSNVVQSYVIRILNSNELAIVTDILPYGKVNNAYAFGLQALGGNPPLRWYLDDGALPLGVTLATNDGTIAGFIANVPNIEATYVFDVTVEDAVEESDTITLELNIDTLNVRLVPSVGFKVNWNYDKYDIDAVNVRFIAALPAGFTRFNSKTELRIWLADYEIALDSSTALLFNQGMTWRSKYGDARIIEGERSDVPVVSAALTANVKKGLLIGAARVRFDDGIGSSFDVDDAMPALLTNLPVEVILTMGPNDVVGHATVPVKYKRNAKGTLGIGRSYKPK
jgi:hypothetical protein